MHDDVMKWKHVPRNWPFVRGIHRSPVNFPLRGQWRGALIFSLICARINGWVNNREAGDLRRHRVHYDVILMIFVLLCFVVAMLWFTDGFVWYSCLFPNGFTGKGRDHFVYAPCQWETTLHCNVVSHWQGAYTKWSLQGCTRKIAVVPFTNMI